MTKRLPLLLVDSGDASPAKPERSPARKNSFVTVDLHARAARVIKETASLLAKTQAQQSAQRTASPTMRQPPMLSLIAHDLVNDLGAAKLCLAAFQQDETAAPSAGASTYLRVLERSLAHMEQLVADLRDAGQMQLGRFALAPQAAVSPAALVAVAVDAAEMYADGRRVELACAPRLPLVRADEGRIQRVFANLIGNAIRSTDAQGTIAVGAKPGATSEYVVFFVWDDGEGIEDADRQRIFEPPVRARGGRRPGAGLALMISRGIVEAHGGQMFVTSRPSAGSTFTFTLPSASVDL